jgi:type IV secretion system protein VirD4
MGWKDEYGRPTGFHPFIYNTLKKAANLADAQLSGVIGTALKNLNVAKDPIVAANLRYSDFKIRDLMNWVDPVSLYVVATPDTATRLRPLIRLFFNLCDAILVGKVEVEGGRAKSPHKFGSLWLIDELPALKKMPSIVTGLGWYAGYLIRVMGVAQNILQLHSEYGDDSPLLAGCQTQMFARPNDVETASLMGKYMGQFDMTTRASRLGDHAEPTARRLLTDDELLAIPDHEFLLLGARYPTECEKLLTFATAGFKERREMGAVEKTMRMWELDGYPERAPMVPNPEKAIARAKQTDVYDLPDTPELQRLRAQAEEAESEEAREIEEDRQRRAARDRRLAQETGDEPASGKEMVSR